MCFFTARNAIIVILTSALAAVLYRNDLTPFSLTGNITGGVPEIKFPQFSITNENQTYSASHAFSVSLLKLQLQITCYIGYVIT